MQSILHKYLVPFSLHCYHCILDSKMAKKPKDKLKSKTKGLTKEQLANENRLASIAARAETAKLASNAIKSALEGGLKTNKSIKFFNN